MFKIKAGEEYEGKLEAVFQVNKILWRVAILETIIIVALVVGYLQLKQAVYVGVELPSKIYLHNGQRVIKGVNWASKNYYQLWGKSLVEDASNFTVENIGKKMSRIQKMMRPTVAIKKDDVIQKYTRGVINNRISQKFEILSEKIIPVSKTEKQLIYHGISRTKIGDRNIAPKECNYIINLKLYENGVLYVQDFGTNCL